MSNFIKNLINPTDNLYLDIYNCSKQMRPGRVTVLDTIDENEFISSINNFINYLEFHESKTIIK